MLRHSVTSSLVKLFCRIRFLQRYWCQGIKLCKSQFISAICADLNFAAGVTRWVLKDDLNDKANSALRKLGLL